MNQQDQRGLGPVYADSVKERTVPKVQVEETLCPVGTGPPSMAFKEKEVPDMLLATKGQVGETSEGFRQSLGTGFTQPDPSWLYPIVEVGAPSEVFGTKTTRGTGLVNAEKNSIFD